MRDLCELTDDGLVLGVFHEFQYGDGETIRAGGRGPGRHSGTFTLKNQTAQPLEKLRFLRDGDQCSDNMSLSISNGLW